MKKMIEWKGDNEVADSKESDGCPIDDIYPATKVLVMKIFSSAKNDRPTPYTQR